MTVFVVHFFCCCCWLFKTMWLTTEKLLFHTGYSLGDCHGCWEKPWLPSFSLFHITCAPCRMAQSLPTIWLPSEAQKTRPSLATRPPSGYTLLTAQSLEIPWPLQSKGMLIGRDPNIQVLTGLGGQRLKYWL